MSNPSGLEFLRPFLGKRVKDFSRGINSFVIIFEDNTAIWFSTPPTHIGSLTEVRGDE